MRASLAIGLAVALGSLVAARAAEAQEPPPLPPPETDTPPPPSAPAPAEPAPMPAPYGAPPADHGSPLPPPAVRPPPPAYERTVEDIDVTRWKPHVRRTAIGLDTHVWSAERTGTGLPMVPFFSAELGETAAIELRMPAAFAFGTGASAAGAGNPTLSILYAPTHGAFTWFIGGRLSAPLANAAEGDGQAALLYGRTATAYYDLQHWTANYVPLGLRTGLEYQSIDGLFFRVSWDPTLYFPTSGGDVVFVHQMRAEIEGRSRAGFGGGFALQYAHLVQPSSRFDGGSVVQTAMEPFFAFESKSSFFMRAGWLVALDEPLGFGFDRGKVASFRLSIGSQL